jgi:hypothetical protein
LTLTVIAVLTAGVNLGSHSVNAVIALAIASTKGTPGLVFLAVLLTLCFVDMGTRDDPCPANLRPPAGGAALVRPQ